MNIQNKPVKDNNTVVSNQVSRPYQECCYLQTSHKTLPVQGWRGHIDVHHGMQHKGKNRCKYNTTMLQMVRQIATKCEK